MRDIKKEVETLFNNLSDQDFDEMLNEAGFGVQEGNGEIIYKDTNSQFMFAEDSGSIRGKITSTFRMKQTKFNTDFSGTGVKINSFAFKDAC